MNNLEEIPLEEKRENVEKSNVIYIDKDEHDKKCAKYSTYGFLFGIACIMIYGILYNYQM